MSTVADDPKLDAPAQTVVTTGEQVAPPPAEEQAPERAKPEAPSPYGEEEKPLTKEEVLRPSIGALMTGLGCAFMVGGLFQGISPRFYAAFGAMAGAALAVWAGRAAAEGGRRANLVQAASLLGVFFAGLLAIGITNPGNIPNVTDLIGEAMKNMRLRTPPAHFDTGWRAVLPWTVGMITYAAAYIGGVGRKPALGVLLPIPFTALSAVAQPDYAQMAAGIVTFATFAIGLAIVYRADRGEGAGVSMAYELKRAARTAPLVLVLVGALIGLSQAGFLFPDPIYDPTQLAQKPKAIPLKDVQDRVLFTVRSENFTGPWRTGVLDVYNDKGEWLIPPFAAGKLTPAPDSGRLYEVFGNPDSRQLRATITLEGLEGTVLPLPSRVWGIRGTGIPKLVTNRRDQTVRVEMGTVQTGLVYEIAFANLPNEEALKTAPPPNEELKEFLDTRGFPPPPAVQDLLAQADAKRLESPWERMDFMRKTLLDGVTASGQGLPAAVPPEKVEDMLAGSKEGTPFEIVAAQALMARWAGVPSRIGYGFDKGEPVADSSSIREIRPKHGASWLEVYFQGHGWFPVTGLPKTTKLSISNSSITVDADILPSDEIQVSLWVPLRKEPEALLFKQIQKILLLASPFILVGLIIWISWPAFYKARRRSKRRQWALRMGPAARIAVAYTELRDMATDLGVGDPYATPLAYTRRVVPDEEHRELAWLVTRSLWGDLRDTVGEDEVFAAEELSRSLRRRLFEAQPFTIRLISLVSRLSLRDPYAPELLSPPVKKVPVKSFVKNVVLFPVKGVRGLVSRRKKEIPDVETA